MMQKRWKMMTNCMNKIDKENSEISIKLTYI